MLYTPASDTLPFHLTKSSVSRAGFLSETQPRAIPDHSINVINSHGEKRVVSQSFVTSDDAKERVLRALVFCLSLTLFSHTSSCKQSEGRLQAPSLEQAATPPPLLLTRWNNCVLFPSGVFCHPPCIWAGASSFPFAGGKPRLFLNTLT